MGMGINSAKFILLLINVFFIVFPILFAMNVFTSFTKEESIIEKLNDGLDGMDQYHVPNMVDYSKLASLNCSSTAVVFNVGFAVLLAALWNSSKLIKTGSI